ncbi:MAG: hypothetical protein EOL91_09355 [Actinobacteria bacterium]|nr:hypothetical protein [Actinomycetota bacterium]
MRSLTEQLDRWIELGVPGAIGVGEVRLREVAVPVLARAADLPGAVLVMGPRLAPAAALVPLLDRHGRAGFVVPDMTDVAEFSDIDGLDVPDVGVYAVGGVERGDEMAGWSPDEALPEILGRGRTPLTVHEGICWLLQEPAALERKHCFMVVGSRRRQGARLDRRVPALWISGGSERDGGRARRGAPKLGWCWAGNRHTWLGFASAAGRIG